MPAKVTSDLSQRPVRAGMVGGGRGAFIGAVHRIAVELDDGCGRVERRAPLGRPDECA